MENHLSLDFKKSDPTKLTFNFNGQSGSLDATAVSYLIGELIKTRTAMQPPIAFDWAIGQRVFAVPDPAFSIAPEPMSGGLMLGIAHPGAGMLFFHFSPEQRDQMLAAIQKQQVASGHPAPKSYN